MKTKRNVLFSMIVLLTGVINFAGYAQQKDSVYNAAEDKVQSGIQAPKSIVRNITQDKKGNIWIASWEGVFKFDGKLFSNVTKDVSSARFFLFWKTEREIFGSVLWDPECITMMENHLKTLRLKMGLPEIASRAFMKIMRVLSGSEPKAA
jgi:ligand-binding sensor domain-containing protein